MDDLKSAWKGIPTESTKHEALKNMLQEGKHPVLKSMRRQLLFEVICFSALLAVYYDFFDGDKKPLYLNALLVAAVLFAIVHSLAAYLLSRRKLGGNDLLSSLQRSLASLRTTAVLSVTSRVLTTTCLLLFFTAGITFTMQKYWVLIAMIPVFLIQGWFLTAIWRKRITRLRASIQLIEK